MVLGQFLSGHIAPTCYRKCSTPLSRTHSTQVWRVKMILIGWPSRVSNQKREKGRAPTMDAREQGLKAEACTRYLRAKLCGLSSSRHFSPVRRMSAYPPTAAE